jgi:hypothetical protein
MNDQVDHLPGTADPNGAEHLDPAPRNPLPTRAASPPLPPHEAPLHWTISQGRPRPIQRTKTRSQGHPLKRLHGAERMQHPMPSSGLTPLPAVMPSHRQRDPLRDQKRDTSATGSTLRTCSVHRRRPPFFLCSMGWSQTRRLIT